jgi:SAM-dependent methyltransferase
MSDVENLDDLIAGNHNFWEQAAGVHGTTPDDRYYQLNRVIAGGTLMTSIEENAIARATAAPLDQPLSHVGGLDILYLQSHIGVDGVVLARAGANVTCADFSAVALQRARDLASTVGVSIDTVEADSRNLPETLHARFDMVYVTIGAICWIDDLNRWMSQVALALRPGGRLVMFEIHPLYQVFSKRTPELVLDFPYGDGGHFTESGSGSYADPSSAITSTTTNFAHSIANVVTSAISAGMRIDRLDEFVELAFDPRGDDLLQQGDDGQWRLLVGRGVTPADQPEGLPVAFSLIATKV